MIPKEEDLLRRMKLQRSVARIQREVSQLSKKSRFLQQNTAQHDLPTLQRQELNVVAMLGNGSFSEVHELWRIQPAAASDPVQQEAREYLERTCLDSDGRGQYVIKYLRNDLQSDEMNFQRAAADLEMEAKFLANLDHPNIIKIRAWSGGVDSFLQGCIDSFFLVLDRVDGTLLDRMAHWRSMRKNSHELYPERLEGYASQLQCAHQVASALEYLHSHRIVYRDLKPENVGFRHDQVILFDFGLCRELPEADFPQQDTFQMSGVGTRRYMAPEVFLGREYNEKVDVYSWGLILHTIIALRKPFNTYSSKMYEELVCRQGVRPYVYPHIPAGIQNIMTKCWTQDYRRRPSMRAVCDHLRRLRSGDDCELPSSQLSVDSNAKVCGNVRRTDILQKSFDAWGTLSDVLCGTNKIGKKASSFMRFMEQRMLEPPATLGRTRSIDYPELHHLRSSYL